MECGGCGGCVGGVMWVVGGGVGGVCGWKVGWKVEVVGGLVVMVPWAAVRSVVTCFSGWKEVGRKWEKWEKEVGEGEKKEVGGRWRWDGKKGKKVR